MHPVFGTLEQRSKLRGSRQDTLVKRDSSSISMKLSSLYACAPKPGPVFPVRVTYDEVVWFEAGTPTFDAIIKIVGSDRIGRERPIKG